MKNLNTYLRTLRKQSGLSQMELAYLLGFGTESLVGKHERWERAPSFGNLMAYEHVFQKSSRQMFLGMYEKVGKRVDVRAEKLCLSLNRRPSSAIRDRKLKFLRAILSQETSRQF